MKKTGILLINLGSPDSPEVKDIRVYLKEFLSDARVMTMPAIIRFIILHCMILPFRPRKIRQKYLTIWNGSSFPLIQHTTDLAAKLGALVAEDTIVRSAMRYGNPSLREGLNELKKSNVAKIIIVPLFPQYSSATTGSVIEKSMEIVKTWNTLPELIFLPHFYNHEGFIGAFSEKGMKSWAKAPDHVLFSFHGLPESHILAGDQSGHYCLKKNNCCQSISELNQSCYRAQCYETAKLIAKSINIPESSYSVSFQSRLGRTKWLEPYTVEHVKAVANKGVSKLMVFCPSFVADCLETTEEIGEELKAEFLAAGGTELDLVPSLNSDDIWVEGLSRIIGITT